MKSLISVVVFLFAGCATLPTNTVDNSIPETVVSMPMGKATAFSEIVKVVAKNGWKIEEKADDKSSLIASDPTVMPGWMFSYNVRYIISLEEMAQSTDVKIEGVAIMHGDGGDFVKEGRTSALKTHEEKLAGKLRMIQK